MAWNSSKVKYSRLPSQSVAIEFGKAFKFDSVFTYGNKQDYKPAYLTEQREYKPSFLINLCNYLVIFLSFLFLILTFPISLCIYIKVVQQYERIVVFRIGRLQPLKGPGVVLILPWIDSWNRIDMRMRAFNVPPQKIYTTDGAVISIGANVHFQICDGIGSVACVKDMNHSTRVIGQTALLNLLSGKSYQEIESERHSINRIMQVGLNEATQKWGVQVTRVEISEITLLKEANPFAAGPLLVPPAQSTSFDAQGAMNAVSSVLSSFNWQPTSPPAHLSSASPHPSSEPCEPPIEQPHPPTDESSGPSLKPGEIPTAAAEASDESMTAAAVTMSPDDILSAVKLLLNESLVENIGAIYKFVLHGSNSGIYFLDLKNGNGDAGKGEPPNGEADVVLEMTSPDMQLLFSGELRPFQAYLSGRLVVKGDRGLAMKLDQVVKGLQAHN
ncbi:LOW QUALITY PROTEIN: stomatin-like protein 1 [Ptychodera flava]|uniref:LOW QUALITY PROTEIN: stomatin-like protein 1 n=1 Tax=Ptychodera flava TaxID=63121 RepID=UPI00396AA9F9